MMTGKSKFAALVSLLALTGCAHQNSVDKKVEQEMEKQPPVAMGGPLAAESHRLIMESPELSPGQKEKFLALHARLAGEVKAIREEEGRLKMVFFKTILSPESEEAEISNLKTRILELDRRKTNRMLGAFEEARVILGRQVLKDNERLYRAFAIDGRGNAVQ